MLFSGQDYRLEHRTCEAQVSNILFLSLRNIQFKLKFQSAIILLRSICILISKSDLYLRKFLQFLHVVNTCLQFGFNFYQLFHFLRIQLKLVNLRREILSDKYLLNHKGDLGHLSIESFLFPELIEIRLARDY
ncbi:hypothetical protein FGO68_gene9066 [Halteria grandinella]|uniref:Uncharacterized protein n=1 Tax=Halteria grandinella TaxID=5974 RepID=A0A8J8NZB3_HALGN|nr:hypothetical protein FGO68_gene9066 [Halteria grandinella]